MIINIQDIEEALQAIPVESANELTGETKLSALGIDSLDLFSVVAFLEDKSGKKISDESYEKLEKVNDLIWYFNE